MTITRLKLERFTAFEALDFKPSPGINVLVGANGTGKTHLMKVAYAACDVSKTRADFAEKLARVFMPSKGVFGRLVKRRGAGSSCEVRRREEDDLVFHSLYRDDGEIACHSVGIYLDIHPNAIAEAFTDLYDREVERSLGVGTAIGHTGRIVTKTTTARSNAAWG